MSGKKGNEKMKCTGNYKLDCENEATHERERWDCSGWEPVCERCANYYRRQGLAVKKLKKGDADDRQTDDVCRRSDT